MNGKTFIFDLINLKKFSSNCTENGFLSKKTLIGNPCWLSYLYLILQKKFWNQNGLMNTNSKVPVPCLSNYRTSNKNLFDDFARNSTVFFTSLYLDNLPLGRKFWDHFRWPTIEKYVGFEWLQRLWSNHVYNSGVNWC